MEDLDLLSKDLINCEPHHRDAEYHSNRRRKLSPKYRSMFRTDKNKPSTLNQWIAIEGQLTVHQFSSNAQVLLQQHYMSF